MNSEQKSQITIEQEKRAEPIQPTPATKNPKAAFMPREIAIAGNTGDENFRSKELN